MSVGQLRSGRDESVSSVLYRGLVAPTYTGLTTPRTAGTGSNLSFGTSPSVAVPMPTGVVAGDLVVFIAALPTGTPPATTFISDPNWSLTVVTGTPQSVTNNGGFLVAVGVYSGSAPQILLSSVITTGLYIVQAWAAGFDPTIGLGLIPVVNQGSSTSNRLGSIPGATAPAAASPGGTSLMATYDTSGLVPSLAPPGATSVVSSAGLQLWSRPYRQGPGASIPGASLQSGSPGAGNFISVHVPIPGVASTTGLYTVPAACSAVDDLDLFLTNPSAASVGYFVAVNGVAFAVGNLLAGQQVEYEVEDVLAPGDVVSISAGVTNVLAAHVSGKLVA